MVRALASHQCGPGSIPGPDAISGLSLCCFFSGFFGFPPSTKTNIQLIPAGCKLCSKVTHGPYSGCQRRQCMLSVRPCWAASLRRRLATTIMSKTGVYGPLALWHKRRYPILLENLSPQLIKSTMGRTKSASSTLNFLALLSSITTISMIRLSNSLFTETGGSSAILKTITAISTYSGITMRELLCSNKVYPNKKSAQIKSLSK